MFLPSLLEYSTDDFNSKLKWISGNPETFKKVAKADNDELHFHLDFVLEEFAAERGVETGLSLEQTFNNLERYFAQNKLVLSIHLMGSEGDLNKSFEYFKSQNYNQKWKYVIFVPESYYNSWTKLSSIISGVSNVQIGVWYDLGEWETKNFEITDNFLLMTVKAGKSGQKLTPENIVKSMEVVKNYPNKQFILDGGWSVDYPNLFQNCQIVSYSSFWKNLRN